MKKYLFLYLLLAPILAFANDATYTLNGSVKKTTPKMKAYLIYKTDQQEYRIDSTKVINGRYTFSGKAEYPFFAQLVLDHDGKSFGKQNVDVLKLYIDPSTVTVETIDSVAKATVKGAPTNDLNLEFKKLIAEVSNRGNAIQKAYQNATPEQRNSKQFTDSLNNLFIELQGVYNNTALTFIQSHPNSMLSVYMLQSEINMHPNNTGVELVFNTLADSIRHSIPGQQLAATIDKYKSLPIGETTPDFTSYDIHGKAVKLSDYRGKYTLLVFWSPECDHCRGELPNLLKAYQLFAGKEFDILAMAVEDASNKQQWIDTVNQFGLTWTNVSDLKLWNSETVKQYRIFSVPFNYLLDKEGKVIAKEVYGDALIAKLNEILEKK